MQNLHSVSYTNFFFSECYCHCVNTRSKFCMSTIRIQMGPFFSGWWSETFFFFLNLHGSGWASLSLRRQLNTNVGYQYTRKLWMTCRTYLRMFCTIWCSLPEYKNAQLFAYLWRSSIAKEMNKTLCLNSHFNKLSCFDGTDANGFKTGGIIVILYSFFLMRILQGV